MFRLLTGCGPSQEMLTGETYGTLQTNKGHLDSRFLPWPRNTASVFKSGEWNAALYRWSIKMERLSKFRIKRRNPQDLIELVASMAQRQGGCSRHLIELVALGRILHLQPCMKYDRPGAVGNQSDPIIHSVGSLSSWSVLLEEPISFAVAQDGPLPVEEVPIFAMAACLPSGLHPQHDLNGDKFPDLHPILLFVCLGVCSSARFNWIGTEVEGEELDEAFNPVPAWAQRLMSPLMKEKTIEEECWYNSMRDQSKFFRGSFHALVIVYAVTE